LATPEQLSAFLAEVERRAFRQAMYAVQNEDVALDLVQDAMLKLAESYGARPAEELPLLFQRILQNAIRDYYRRSKVRSTWTTLLSAFGGGNDEDEEGDPLETLEIEPHSEAYMAPDQQLNRVQTLNLIDEALQRLPARQREAFLMRYMEEMDVAETAAAMGCSEGSVKTHCSRAVHAMAIWLKEKGVGL
jgi:RNA polymerase sigma-70 factor (ECF subfamily)